MTNDRAALVRQFGRAAIAALSGGKGRVVTSPVRGETHPTRTRARTRVKGYSGVRTPFLRRVTMCACGACDDCAARRRLWAALRASGPRSWDGRCADRLRKRRHRPARDERPRCGARCRDGHACLARVVWIAGELVPRKRCRNHGGLSTGPRTADGRARSLEALARGRASLAARRSAGPTEHKPGVRP